MKNNKMILTIIFSLSVIVLSPLTSLGHSDCDSGGESYGFIVNCDKYGHSLYSNYTYKFEDNIAYKYVSYTSEGAKRWNDATGVNIQPDTDSINTVSTYGGPDFGTTAFVRSYWDSTGHKTKWELNYNRYYMDDRSDYANNETAAHEMGHTIGLGDLEDYNNRGNLMYGYTTRTVSYPSFSDVRGVNEILK